MELNDHDIEEFQALWKKEFKEEILAEYAWRRANEFLDLYALLIKVNTSAARQETPEYRPKGLWVPREVREHEAVRIIRNFIRRENRMPSMRELGKALGYKSTRSAHVLLQRFVTKGILARRRDGRLVLP